MAPVIPIVVWNTKRDRKARAGTRMMKGIARNRLMILSRIQNTHLFGAMPSLRVITTTTARIRPRMMETRPDQNNMTSVSQVAFGN